MLPGPGRLGVVLDWEDGEPRTFEMSYKHLYIRSLFPSDHSRFGEVGRTNINIVVQFYPPRAVELHSLQCLSDNIIRLPLRGLSGLDHGGLVNIALVINIQFAKGVLEGKYVLLLELRVFPKNPQLSLELLPKDDRIERKLAGPLRLKELCLPL